MHTYLSVILFSLSFFYFPSLFAQNCHFDTWQTQLHLSNPESVERKNSIEKITYDYFSKYQQGNNEKSLLSLPIVVHIIHENGIENISDAQIFTGVEHLNAAFANIDLYNEETGVDTEIQFCLAQRTPEEELTNGITRQISPQTDGSQESQSLYEIVSWNTTQYINIWVVKDLCAEGGALCDLVAGKATAPFYHGYPYDGVYIEAAYFGTSSQLSTALVHEVGHYLGLRHTFSGGCQNDDCLSNGDLVCDTPPDNSTAYNPCGEDFNSCTTDINLADSNNPFTTDQSDMTWNYMDYGWSCYSAFTEGQKGRMRFMTENFRSSLLNSLACTLPCLSPLSADFTASNEIVEVGSTVFFENESIGATEFMWTINDEVISTNESFSYDFENVGIYNVALHILNEDPNCFEAKEIFIEVYCPVEGEIIVNENDFEIDIPISFSAETLNETNIKWSVNNELLAEETTEFTFTPTGVGSYSVLLELENEYCSNFSEFFFVIEGGCEDEIGDIWEKKYNGGLCNIKASSSGDVYSYGFTKIIHSGNSDTTLYELKKITPSGIIEKNITLGDFIQGEGNQGLEEENYYLTPDNEIILVGFQHTEYGDSFDHKLTLVKLNEDLEVLWQKSYDIYGEFGTGSTETAYSSLDNTIVVSVGKRINSSVLMKFDLNGNIVWSKVLNEILEIEGEDYSWRGDLQILSNGDIVLTGIQVFSSSLYNANTIMIGKIDINGESIWKKNYEVENTLWTQIMVTEEDDIVFSYRFNAGHRQAFAKVNSEGLLVWAKRIVRENDPLSNNSLIYFAKTGDDNYLYFTDEDEDNHKHTFLKYSIGGEIIWKRDLLSLNGYLSLYPTENNIYYNTTLSQTSKADLNGYAGDCFIADFGEITFEDAMIDSIFERQIIVQDTLIEFIGSPILTPTTREVYQQGACNNIPIDLSISIDDINQCTENTEVNLTICNTGQVDAFPEIPIRFYAENPQSNIISSFSETILNNYIRQDSCLSLLVDIPNNSTGNTFVVVNDEGNTLTPFDLSYQFAAYEQPECDYTNNIDSVFFTPIEIRDLSLGEDTIFCGTVDLLLEADENSWFSEYLWQDSSNNSSLLVNSPDTYSVTVTDECGFTQEDEIVVLQVQDASLLDLGEDIMICQNSTALFSVEQNYNSYLWQDGSVSADFTAWLPGIYWVEVEDYCGNVQRDSIEVFFDESLSLDLGVDIIACPQDEVILSVNTLNFTSFQWSPNIGLSCIDCPNPILIPQTSQTYYLTASNDEGCYATDSILITVSGLVSTLATDTIFCVESEAALSISPEYTQYAWFPSEAVSCSDCPTIEITSTLPQTISVEITDDLGCTLIDSIFVDFATINIESENLEPTCNGLSDGQIILSSDTDLEYSLDGQNWQLDNLFSDLIAGNYTVFGRDENGCIFEHEAFLDEPESLGIEGSSDATIAQGDTVTLSVMGSGGTLDYIYTWTPSDNLNCSDCSEVIASPEENISYIIAINDVNGCEALDTIFVSVSNDKSIFIPNAFSPNGDNFNDRFTVFGSLNVAKVDFLRVYDKWGELVFSNSDFSPNDESLGWDGTHRGERLVSQVLVYVTQVTFTDGSTQTFSGDVSMLR